MKLHLGLLILITLNACGSRPCRIAASIPPPPCRAEGSNAEGWRIASGFCRDLEASGAEIRQVQVNGTHVSLWFSTAFGQRLLAEKSALHQSVEDFLSRMQRETGVDQVSVEVLSGEVKIASGEAVSAEAPLIKISE
jgi:hypothetical protein